MFAVEAAEHVPAASGLPQGLEWFPPPPRGLHRAGSDYPPHFAFQGRRVRRHGGTSAESGQNPPVMRDGSSPQSSSTPAASTSFRVSYLIGRVLLIPPPPPGCALSVRQTGLIARVADRGDARLERIGRELGPGFRLHAVVNRE